MSDVKGATSMKKMRPSPTTDGMGATVKRLMPTRSLPYLDPFLLLDHFAIQQPAGFPSHPHRGFEIITYMLEGAFRHADSAGHAGTIPAGGLQRITAGRGVVHSEFPAGDGVSSGLQLWINLPRAEKTIEPSYQDVAPERLPTEAFDGISIKTLVGEGSPVEIRRPMVYYDIFLSQGKTHSLSVPKGYQALFYVLEGQGRFGETAGAEGEALIPEPPPQAETVDVSAVTALRFVFLAGEPVGERPVFRGSFVD